MKNRYIKIINIAFILLLLIGCNTTISENLINGRETVRYAKAELINRQAETDAKIKEYLDDKSYIFTDPKVLVNPYEIAPLTALIIFNTDKKTAIGVNINDYLYFDTVETTQHIIPIYGLYDGKDNIITLTDDDGSTSQVVIHTESFKGERLNVEISDVDKLDDKVYFLSPNFVENCIYDKYGNLLWYINDDYAGDIEFLDNGHFLISDPNQGTNGVKINYSSFLEMDYLGKIYKQFIPEFGYHHELVLLDNKGILTTGAKDDSPFMEAVLYEFDSETGQTKWSIDFYEKLHEIAPDWIESLGNQFDFVLNSIDYDKNNNDVLLSFRGIGVIALYDLDNDNFIWMFGDPDNLPDEFDRYILENKNGIKYPYGQHSAFFTKEGYVSFHNNDADQLNMGSSMLIDYLDKYTTNIVFKVNDDKSVSKIWEYDGDRKYWSKVGGMLSFMDNGHTLIDYGYCEAEKAYENSEKISINDTSYLHGVILELDDNDDTLFKAKMNELIFRTFKMDLYTGIVDNYEIKDFTKVDGSVSESESMNISDIKDDLLKAEKFNEDVYVLTDRIFVEKDFEVSDEVKILLVDNDDNAYVVTYKGKDRELPVFNSGRYGRKINVRNGRYKVYLIINDVYYDSDTVIVFD